MRKMLFGCTLMLVGAICGTGWLLACATLIEPGAWTTMTNLFPWPGFGLIDGYIVLVFYAISIIGFIISIRAFSGKE